MTRWTEEKEFEEHFKALRNPRAELADLAEWRTFQTKVVSKFIDQIRLVASEQYSNLDHFLLELLQNADDNQYAEGATPTVHLTLDQEFFRLENNERGFTAENLFAITYAAASTKIREATGATFIGEKGIGFKSVFAVADYVEIHSPPYHFRLNNGEFLIPYPAEPRRVQGTEIVLRLRTGNAEIPQILSKRLATLCENAQEFLLFLQKIECLRVIDRVSNTEREVAAVRDREKDFYVVESDGKQQTYLTHRYTETVPESVVQTRFPDLAGNLEREIVFAVPVPSDDGAPPGRSGKLFCFLPTEVRTGAPIHIQVDAKTTTNRENIKDFAGSDWNRTIFANLGDAIVEMFEGLAVRGEFAERLPEYFPWDIQNQELKNLDLKKILVGVKEELKEANVFRDRHGKYSPAAFAKVVPPRFRGLLYEDKYEQGMSRYLVSKGAYNGYTYDGYSDAEVATLIDPVWADRYSEQLKAMGVEEVADDVCLRMLREGPPSGLDIRQEEGVRAFLREVLDYADTIKSRHFYSPSRSAIEDLKACPIFPLHDGKKAYWGALTDQVMWMKNADSPDTKGGSEAVLVDVRYTYNPGGSATKKEGGEEIRDLNRRFRSFLEACDIDSFGPLEDLRRTLLPKLKKGRGKALKDIEDRKEWNQLWFSLYRRLWNRRTTLIKAEGGESAWQEILREVGECGIPIQEAGEKGWRIEPVREAFLGSRFRTRDPLSSIYRGTGAPIIDLDLLPDIAQKERAKKRRKVNWDDWREFLVECGAKTRPYLVQQDLKNNSRYASSRSSGYHMDDPLGEGIREAISGHPQYSAEGAKEFTLSAGSPTWGVDPYTEKLLCSRQDSDFLARGLGPLWERRSQYSTTIKFVWGYKQSNRNTQTDRILLEAEAKKDLPVVSDVGIRPAAACFEDNHENRRVLGALVPYVDVEGRGYNRDLLQRTGFRTTIAPSDVRELIRASYDGHPSGQRNAERFVPYLEMVTRFATGFPEHLPDLRASLMLYTPDSDELVPVAAWKHEAFRAYPAPVVEALLSALEPDGKASLAGVLGSLLACSPLERRPEALAEALARLGRFVEVHGQDGIREKFSEMLAGGNLTSHGTRIRGGTDLPILWDRIPMPANNPHLIALPASMLGDPSVHLGADVVGWPRLGRLGATTATVGSMRRVDEVSSRRAYYSFQRLLRDLERAQPHLMRRIESLRLFSDPDTAAERVAYAEAVRVSTRNGSAAVEVSVPYWYEEGALVITEGQDLARVLPEFVDLTCGTTFTSTFRYVWEDADALSRVHKGTEERDASDIPEHPRPGGGTSGDTQAGSASDLEVGLDDPEEGDEDGGAPDGGDKSRGGGDSGDGKRKVRKRSRLCSLVVSKRTTRSVEERKEADERRKQVEEAGRQRLRGYFGKLGATCVSREPEDLGYDFDVTVGEETFFVELKASEDRWQGWEEALSRNEFLKARELREKYFLCVVDRALSEDWSIYFIKDPAGEVDYYLFDHPWRTFAEDMNGYVSRLKAQQNILDE